MFPQRKPSGASAVYLRDLVVLWSHNHTNLVSHFPKCTPMGPLCRIARRNPKYSDRAAGALLLFSLVALLVACQGVSAGPSIQTSPQEGSTLSLANGTLNFGNVAVGTTATLSIVATNSGPSSVTVSSVSISSQLFQLVAPSLPVTVAGGQSTTMTVTFSPTAVGTFNATASISSDATNATSTLSLTGTGVSGTGTSGTYSVNLSWTGSTSPNISGYNIYRAVYSPAPVNACGSFAKINPALNAGTAYTDSNLTDGTAYCYAATAVNTSNEESGYSNIVSDVQIPAP